MKLRGVLWIVVGACVASLWGCENEVELLPRTTDPEVVSTDTGVFQPSFTFDSGTSFTDSGMDGGVDEDALATCVDDPYEPNETASFEDFDIGSIRLPWGESFEIDRKVFGGKWADAETVAAITLDGHDDDFLGLRFNTDAKSNKPSIRVRVEVPDTLMGVAFDASLTFACNEGSEKLECKQGSRDGNTCSVMDANQTFTLEGKIGCGGGGAFGIGGKKNSGRAIFSITTTGPITECAELALVASYRP